MIHSATCSICTGPSYCHRAQFLDIKTNNIIRICSDKCLFVYKNLLRPIPVTAKKNIIIKDDMDFKKEIPRPKSPS